MRSTGLALVLVAILASAGVSTAGLGATNPSLEQLVGQRLIVAMRGGSPSAALLARVREGRVGGVILFGANVRGPAQVRALTQALRTAARAGANPLCW